MAKVGYKIFLSILLLLTVTICFTACASINVATISNDDGTIDELVTITLDQSALINEGLDVDSVKADIKETSLDSANQIINEFNIRVRTELFTTLNIEVRNILNSYINGITVISNDWNGDKYVIGIRFKNIDIYRHYYNITEEVQVEMTTEEHFLYNKISYQSYTMYASYNALYNSLASYFTSEYPAFEIEDSERIYTYVADSSRQHSDADYVTRSQGKYYHSWRIDGTDDVVTFYYKVANRTNWIYVCLGLTAVTTLILGIVSLTINLCKKSKHNQINN